MFICFPRTLVSPGQYFKFPVSVDLNSHECESANFNDESVVLKSSPGLSPSPACLPYKIAAVSSSFGYNSLRDANSDDSRS